MRRSVNHIGRNRASLQIEKMVQALLLIKLAKSMVGTEGARLLDKDSNVLVVPQNGLTRTVPVETKTIAASTLTGVVGSDFTLLRAVQVNLSNQTLAGSAELAIPTPADHIGDGPYWGRCV